MYGLVLYMYACIYFRDCMDAKSNISYSYNPNLEERKKIENLTCVLYTSMTRSRSL